MSIVIGTKKKFLPQISGFSNTICDSPEIQIFHSMLIKQVHKSPEIIWSVMVYIPRDGITFVYTEVHATIDNSLWSPVTFSIVL